MYQIVKYQKLHNQCYDIKGQTFQDYNIDLVTQGLESPGIFEVFDLGNGQFTNVSKFTVTIHSFDVDPRGTDLFPTYVDRNSYRYSIESSKSRTENKIDTSQVELNSFSFSFAIYVNRFLSPP